MSPEQAIHLKVLPSTSRSQLAIAADNFYLDREANRCAEATLVWYRKYVGALVDWLTAQGVRGLSDVTASNLRAWLVSLQKPAWLTAPSITTHRQRGRFSISALART